MQIELYVNTKISVFYRSFDDFITVAHTVRNYDHTFILIFLLRNGESLMEAPIPNAHTAGGQLNMNEATL